MCRMRLFTFKLMDWTWINHLMEVKAINTLQAWNYILFSHQEVHSEHKEQRRSVFIKTNYQLLVSLVVSCLLFSAQFSQATSKWYGFQLVKLSRKAELISNTTDDVPPPEKQPSIQLSPFKRQEAAVQKAQGVKFSPFLALHQDFHPLQRCQTHSWIHSLQLSYPTIAFSIHIFIFAAALEHSSL